VICDQCRRDNPPGANFCSFCGVDLRDTHPKRSWSIPAVIVVALIGGLAAYLGIHSDPVRPVKPQSQPKPDATPSVSVNPPAAMPSGAVSEDAAAEVEPVVGVVLIRDAAGNPRARIPSAVSRSGWVALPVARCRIGSDWFLHLATGQRPRIEGGLVGEGDAVAIWRIEPGYSIDSPALTPWRPDRPLHWHSIVSSEAVPDLPVAVLEERLYMTRAFCGTAPRGGGSATASALPISTG